MNENDYILRKSNMVKSLFSKPPVKGTSEKEFIDSIRIKILNSVNFDSTFFNDVNIDGKSMLDYYSSSEASVQEKEFFTKTFNDIEILRKFQFNQNHFFEFVSNLGEALSNGDEDIYSKQLKFAFKIIETEWSRDLNTLILEKYKGNNVLSHLFSYGIQSAMFVDNEIQDKKLKTRSLNQKKIEFLYENTKTDLFVENFYFDLLYFSYVNNPEEASYIAQNNKKIISDNLVLVNGNRYGRMIEDSFLLYEKDNLKKLINFNEPDTELPKVKNTKKSRMRL